MDLTTDDNDDVADLQRQVLQNWTGERDGDHPCYTGNGRKPSSIFHDRLTQVSKPEAAAIVTYLAQRLGVEPTSTPSHPFLLKYGMDRYRAIDKLKKDGAEVKSASTNPKQLSPQLKQVLNETLAWLADEDGEASTGTPRQEHGSAIMARDVRVAPPGQALAFRTGDIVPAKQLRKGQGCLNKLLSAGATPAKQATVASSSLLPTSSEGSKRSAGQATGGGQPPAKMAKEEQPELVPTPELFKHLQFAPEEEQPATSPTDWTGTFFDTLHGMVIGPAPEVFEEDERTICDLSAAVHAFHDFEQEQWSNDAALVTLEFHPLSNGRRQRGLIVEASEADHTDDDANLAVAWHASALHTPPTDRCASPLLRPYHLNE
eukprot:m.48742 g.48742  ORF g.48742 m.48742 type:complete len:374 (+) comp13315_c0_seq2:199-1320(+)